MPGPDELVPLPSPILSARDHQVLAIIEDFTEMGVEGIDPVEIASDSDISIAGVKASLETLERKGMIRAIKGFDNVIYVITPGGRAAIHNA